MSIAETETRTCELIVLDKTGDTKTIWDPLNASEVEAARKSFDDLKRKGFIAYRVRSDGKKGEIMHSFDAQAGSIIMAPLAAGG